MNHIEVGVTGMTCGHCVTAVTAEVSALPEVDSVEVDLRPDAVSLLRIVATGEVPRDALAAAVAEAGYELADPAATG